MVRPFAFWSGIVGLALGGIGMLSMLAPQLGLARVHQDLLWGIVPLTPLLAFIYLLLGAQGLWSSRSLRASASHARTAGVVLGTLAAFAMLPFTENLPGLAALTRDPLWLVGFAAIASAYFGWGEPSREYITLS